MNRIEKAFTAQPRELFLPDEQVPYADVDAPLPIGYGQTNSQPSTVKSMLEWLDPKVEDTVLDVGFGSGWTTALLSELVGVSGSVYATEVIPTLKEFGEQNCRKRGLSNCYFYETVDALGLPDFAPYDRILVSAGAVQYPKEILDQLTKAGRAVIPVKNSVYVYDKRCDGSIEPTEHPGYAFVPLVY